MAFPAQAFSENSFYGLVLQFVGQKNPTPTPGVVRNLPPTLPKNLRLHSATLVKTRSNSIH